MIKSCVPPHAFLLLLPGSVRALLLLMPRRLNLHRGSRKVISVTGSEGDSRGATVYSLLSQVFAQAEQSAPKS